MRRPCVSPLCDSEHATETDTRPIVLKLPTEVVGGGGAVPLAPALAIDAALADDAFAGFVKRYPEARWINPHMQLRDGSWGVGLFVMSDDGQGELFGEVTVDPAGNVVGHRFEP